MKKKGFLLLILTAMLIMSFTVSAAVYPTYTGVNKTTLPATERINIVYDNTDHGYVDDIIQDILVFAALDETSNIWIYPIAGSQAPIKVDSSKAFMEKHYTAYAKPSNELKDENVLLNSFEELKNDSADVTKKFIYFYNSDTAEMNSEYALSNLQNIAKENSDIIFSVFTIGGSSYQFSSYFDQLSNEEYISGKSFFEYALIKTGYSSCKSEYTKESALLKIPKGEADRNIFVVAKNYEHYTNYEDNAYISGYMADSDTMDKYSNKNTVAGVALSYNCLHFKPTDNQPYYLSYAMFTADGSVIDPLNEDLCITVKNAYETEVYYRSTPGLGVCSQDTKYNQKQDKEVVNIFESKEADGEAANKSDINSLFADSGFAKTEEKTGFKKVLSVIGGFFSRLFRIIFNLLKLAVIIFIILLIFYKRFRNIVHIKILESRFGPTFEKLLGTITKKIKSFVNTVTEIKGVAKMDEKFVFISHSSKDIAIPNNRIETVVRELEKKGVKCWLAEKNIMPGQDYNTVLPEAIRNCALFVLFISPSAVKSDEVVTEISTAKEYHKMIVPVQITPFDLFGQFDSWKYMLKQYQKTDLFSNKKEDVDALIKYIFDIYNK